MSVQDVLVVQRENSQICIEILNRMHLACRLKSPLK